MSQPPLPTVGRTQRVCVAGASTIVADGAVAPGLLASGIGAPAPVARAQPRSASHSLRQSLLTRQTCEKMLGCYLILGSISARGHCGLCDCDPIDARQMGHRFLVFGLASDQLQHVCEERPGGRTHSNLPGPEDVVCVECVGGGGKVAGARAVSEFVQVYFPGRFY